MNRYPLVENRTGKLLFDLFLFAILYLTRNSMASTVILGVNQAQFVSLGLICSAGLLFLLRNWRQWKQILLDKRMIVIAVSTVALLIPMVLKRDWQMMYLSVLLCLYFAVFLTFFISYRDVAKYYVIFLTVIGAYSILATYVLRMIPDNGIYIIDVIWNDRDINFFNFGLSFVSGLYVKNRNFGIFREPGVYQYFILLALYLNNYAADWKKQRSMWLVNGILALTMLTTFATGGVVELALLAVVVFFDKKLYRNKRALILVLVLILVMAVALGVIIAQKGMLYWELYGMVISKFAPNEDSSSERLDAIFTDLDFFLKNPLVGARISEVLHSVENNTTSTMLMFAMFGILGGVLHTVSWVALVWEKERKIWVNLALLVIVFMSFNTQNLIADMFFWLFPMMALTERTVPLLKKKE